MRKNELGRIEASTVRRVARRVGAVGARWFRPRPLVPDGAFQDASEAYPGHWRRFPEPWPPDSGAHPAVLRDALATLPGRWRGVLVRRDVEGLDDAQVAAGLGLTVEQERDILARARAALRDRLDAARHR